LYSNRLDGHVLSARELWSSNQGPAKSYTELQTVCNRFINVTRDTRESCNVNY